MKGQHVKQHHFFAWIGLVTLVVLNGPAADAGLTPGIEQLYRLDRLATFRDSVQVASVSSYDRTGGNNDGFGGQYSFVRKQSGGLVLADLEGPGVIYRIWTPTPTDDMMEFYFDGEAEPRIRVKFRELFMGTHPAFERPLVGYGAGGFYSYVPLPYARSCKVFIRAEHMQFYQINYATYPETMGIETFSAQPTSAQRAHIEKAKALFGSAGKDISAYVVPEGGEVETITSKVTLRAGQAATLANLDRPGRIVGIRIGPAEALAGKKRDVVLRAYWDNDPTPAIVSPAGDFFGYAWGEPAMRSLLAGAADGVSYCYFPMPFDRSARIELYAEPGLDRTVAVEAQVLFVPIARRQNEGKFYALWRRENPTTLGKPFTFIGTAGHGHLVGCVQQSQAFETGGTYYFEGDDQTTIDGERVIHGTGSEDFYNGGWYDVPGRWETQRSFVLSGCLGYKKHLGRTGGYRIMLGDAYAYRESLLQTIEHAPTNNDMLNDYCGLTYLYSQDRPTCDFALPPADQRAVLDPDRIIFATWWNVPIYSFSLRNATLTKEGIQHEGREVRFLSMRARETATFGPHSISFTCELPAAGTYRISLDVVKGPEQGKVQLFLDEAPVGPELDLFSEERHPAKDQYIGTLDLEQGPNNLMFKITGKNEKSQGLGFDLTNIICERQSRKVIAAKSSQRAVEPKVMQRVYEQVKTPFKYGVVLKGQDGRKLDCPSVFRHGSKWYMVYILFDGDGYETAIADSDDLLSWRPLGTILPFRHEGWDAVQAAGYVALQDTTWGRSYELETYDGKYWISYIGGALKGYETDPLAVGIAWTDDPTAPVAWQRLGEPVLSRDQPDVRPWESLTQYKSNILHDKNRTLGYPFVMFYNGKAKGSPERIGMAVSNDMRRWRRYGTDPVIDNQTGISGDPQVVRIGDVWVMFYFGAFWRPKAFDTFACSYDLVHWTRWDGPDLVAPSEPYDETYAHKPWLVKHDGVVYHFYCAVGDQGRVIALATSKDLRPTRAR